MLFDSLPVMFARRLLTKLAARSRAGKRLRRRWFPRIEVLEERRVLSGTPPTLTGFVTNQHVDLNLGHNFAANTWALSVRDADNVVSYANDDGVLYVGAPALSTRPAGASFDFIGVSSGDSYYRLPPSQDPSLLYLGVAAYDVVTTNVDRYNPSTESKARVSGSGRWLKASLVGVDHFLPDGSVGSGKFSVWQNGDSGPIVFMSNVNDSVSNPNVSGLDATDGVSSDDAVWVTAGGHLHYNYGFTQVGRYEVSLKLSGYFGDNANNTTPNLAGLRESPTLKLYFSVGNVGQVEFDSASYTVNESAGTASINVRRVNGSDGQITVNYATSNGTALAGSDYTTTNGTLTFLDKETSKTIVIPIINDSDEEPDETINIALSLPGPNSIADYISSPDGDNSSMLGAQSTAVLTILANDPPVDLNNDPVAVADALTVSPNNSVRGNVLFNDSDPDGDPLTAVMGTLPAHGAVILNSDGTFTYTPGPSFAGSDSFGYTLDDGEGGTDSAVVTVTLATTPRFIAYLTNEHTDVGLAIEEVGMGGHEWNLHVHDENHDVEYAPDEALLYVGPSALVARPTSPAFAFIGVAAGENYYRLSESANPELLFLGIGSEEILPGTLVGGTANLRLKSVNGPGHFSLWRSGDLDPEVLMSTENGVTSADLALVLEGSHTHVNWGFSAQGNYQVTFEAVATLTGGEEIVSGDVTYHFGVNVAIPQAPTVTLPVGNAIYKENTAAVNVTTGATVVDTDSTNFNGGSLTAEIIAGAQADDRLRIRHTGSGTGQIGLAGANVTIGGVTVGVVDYEFSEFGISVALNANATPAATAALIKAVTFDNFGDNPTTTTRTVAFTISDGTGRTSEPATRNVAVTAVNDAPVVTTSGGAASYAENAPPVVLDADVLVSDVDSNDFNLGSLKATISTGAVTTDRLTILAEGNAAGQINLDGTNVLFGGVVIGTYVGGFTTSGPLTVTFNGSSSPAAAQALARRIAFHNAGDNPTTATRTISFVVNDGDGKNSLTATKQVSVSVSNDAPAITPTPNTVKYTENKAPIGVLTSSSVVDADSPNSDGGLLTVDIHAGADTLDRLRIRNVGVGLGQIGLSGGDVTFAGVVIGSFTGGFVDNSSLVVSLNGNATVPAVTALVKAVTFDTVGDNPVAGLRTIRFVVSDGDGGTSLPTSRDVNVVAVNDAPVVVNSAGAAEYSENAPPVVIDAGLLVVDVDSPNFHLGTLKVTIGAGKVTTDRLTIATEGDGPGLVNLAGTNVLFGGVVVGVYSGGFTSSGPLTVTFNGNATPAVVEAVGRRIAFHNAGENPTTAPRTITFSVKDGSGKSSLVSSRQVNVSVSNDAPQISSFGVAVSHTEGAVPTLLSSGATLVDPDSLDFLGGSLVVSLVAGATTDDLLAIRHVGVGAGQIGVAGSDVTYAGVVFGSFSGGGAGTPLTVSFNGNATIAAVQALLKNITFKLTASIAANSTRTVRFSLTDGDGGTSPEYEKTINVINKP